MKNKRDEALQVADAAKKRAEAHDHMDTNDAMAYALVLMLADISLRLEETNMHLENIAYGIGSG